MESYKQEGEEMKRLLLVLVFVSFIGCASTNTQPVSHNSEMKLEEPQSEEAKEAGEKAFWFGLEALSWIYFWPF